MTGFQPFCHYTYKVFKQLEILIAPFLGSEETNSLVAADRFVIARDAAVKAMYEEIIGN